MATAARKRTRSQPKEPKEPDQNDFIENEEAESDFEMPPDVAKAMEEANKLYPGIVRKGNNFREANRIPTGCFILDLALLGGYPQGYITMSYGFESCAKTTMFLKGVANYQRKHPDKIVCWNDAEGMYDREWAIKLGVDVRRLVVGFPEYGEQAVDLIDDWMALPSVGLIVNDSLPGMVPMKVSEESAEQEFMALHPRLMGKLCSKITTNNNRERRRGHWITVWNINQLRDNLKYGGYKTLPGGRQINHIPTTKIWLKLKKENMGRDSNDVETRIYNEHGFKLEKTKHGESIKEGEFSLYFSDDNDVGMKVGQVDDIMSAMPFAKKFGFVRGGGASWRLLTAQGKMAEHKFGTLEKMEDYLYENEEERDTLLRSVIAHQRVKKGHSPLPPDGYLVSGLGRLVRLEDNE
jgi:recombination protein RecA